MSNGSDPLRALGGILLILFGLCLTLAGGLCTFFMLLNIRDVLAVGSVVGLISLGTLALGIFTIVKGVRMVGGPRERSD